MASPVETIDVDNITQCLQCECWNPLNEKCPVCGTLCDKPHAEVEAELIRRKKDKEKEEEGEKKKKLEEKKKKMEWKQATVEDDKEDDEI